MIRTLRSGLLLLGATAILTLSFALAGPVEDSQKLLKDGKYDEAIALLEKSDQKQPAIAKALAQAHMAKADYFMNNNQAAPRIKYTTALAEYRKVLVYDRTNKKAQDNIKMIEDIYKSMGRPIPQ
jgi:tetratricopeptide (TPR) repeat protein